MNCLSAAEFAEALRSARQPFHDRYYAMYSSLVDAITMEPTLMVIPIDDHMVHRGDGVFEAFKCVGGNVYNLKAHLDRLESSAQALHLPLPRPRAAIGDIVAETVRAGGRRDCMIRVFAARGPGSFSTNPYDSPHSQLYVVVTALGTPFMHRHPEGAHVRRSAVPAKDGFFAAIKTCNYLPNVLMKREAVDAGVDFVVAFDADGHMTEGPTENAGIVRRGRLLFPESGHRLSGTTMLRVMDLSRQLVESGDLAGSSLGSITYEDIRTADEMLITGTTDNVVAVVEFDGRPVGSGRPGPIFAKLQRLQEKDMAENVSVLTPVFL